MCYGQPTKYSTHRAYWHNHRCRRIIHQEQYRQDCTHLYRLPTKIISHGGPGESDTLSLIRGHGYLKGIRLTERLAKNATSFRYTRSRLCNNLILSVIRMKQRTALHGPIEITWSENCKKSRNDPRSFANSREW